jgi:hypothetical protein
MESSEAPLLRPLRGLILVILALGIAAAVVGSKGMRLFLPVYFLPVAIAYARPRWSQILIWNMWSLTWGMLAMLLAIDGRPALFTVPSHWLLTSAGALQLVALPLVRWSLLRPAASAIPAARLHQRRE